MKLTPPHDLSHPLEATYSGIPDYYRGSLIYYDADINDNCKWIAYNGHIKVRCPTKRDAYDYVQKTTKLDSDNIARLVAESRNNIYNAIRLLDKAATYAIGGQRLTLERLAVSWRPLLVELERLQLTPITKNGPKEIRKETETVSTGTDNANGN